MSQRMTPSVQIEDRGYLANVYRPLNYSQGDAWHVEVLRNGRWQMEASFSWPEHSLDAVRRACRDLIDQLARQENAQNPSRYAPAG